MATRPGRPLLLEGAIRFPWLAHRAVTAALALPAGRLRRQVIELAMRECVSGTFHRSDFAFMRSLVTSEIEFSPAPQLAALLPGQHDDDHPILRGPDACVRFIETWIEEWGEFTFELREVIDLGDARLVTLHHLRTRGAKSGIEITEKEEAELWEFRGGVVTKIQQWWSWAEALEAVGLQLPVAGR
jgi:ketosteroid isomerase-like protein